MTGNGCSRIPGFYKLGLAERRRLLAKLTARQEADFLFLEQGGLDLETADAMTENVVGLHALPLGIAGNFVVNGKEILVPMSVEEPSVIAAASHAAKLVREAGGFVSDVTGSERFMETGNVVAGNPKISKALLQTLRPHLLGTRA